MLAAKVTAPSTAAECSTALPAASSKSRIPLGTRFLMAANLAKASTKRLARQSVADTKDPSERQLRPMDALLSCEDIHLKRRWM